jgi:type I restriction enzyme S subunit
MTKWPVKSLAEVCEINPRLYKNHNITDEQKVSFVPMAAVDEMSGLISSKQVRLFAEVKKGYTYFKDNDVLFAKITPCMENGKATIANELAGGIGFGSTEFHVLRTRGEVLPSWIFHFVRRQQFREAAKRNFTGTAGQQRVPTTFVAEAQIPVPPPAEQSRLIDILTRAESIVRLRREALKKAQEIIPALFLDMFGDPAMNPKGWGVMTVNDALEIPIRNGVSPSKSGTYIGKVLTLSAITRGSFNPFAVKDATFTMPLASGDEVYRNDFLVCRGNGNPDLVGRGCFPSYDMPKVAFPDTAMALRLSPKVIDRSFFAAAWNTAYVRRQIKSVAKTTNGTYKINQTGLGGITLPVPPLSIQYHFAEHSTSIEAIIDFHISALATAEATFQSLLHRAFAGEL